MQQRRSLEEYIESLMYEESLNDLITILSDTIDSLPIGDNIAGYSAGLGGGISNGGGGAECVGSYPVSGYTRSDGTEVSGYIRTCGAAHAGSSSETKSNNQQNTNSENDWDSVNPDDLDDVLDRELLEDYYNNRTPLLEGKVEQIRYVQPKVATEIYSRDELTVEENLQKTLTENLPTDDYRKFMASIDPDVQRQLVFQLTKTKPEYLELFNPDSYLNMLNTLMKPDMVKPMIMLNKDSLVNMISELPSDLMSIVGAQVDTKDLAQYLLDGRMDILGDAMMI